MNITSCAVTESSQHEAVTLPVVVLFPTIHVFMYAVVTQFCSKVVVYLVAETLLTIHILTYAVITECTFGEVT